MPDNFNDSYNGKFKIGNTGANANSVFNDIRPDKQTKGNLKSVSDTTLSFYTQLYGKLETLHTTYLGHIKTAELSHYSKLTGGQGQKGLIYEKYDDLYDRLEKRHTEYLKKIGGNISAGSTVSGTVDDTSTSLASESLFKDISGQLASISINAQTGANNTYAIGRYLEKTDKDNSKYARELKDSIEKGIKDSKTPTSRDKEEDKDRKRQMTSMKEVNASVMDVLNVTQRNLVQGKYMNRLVDDILDVVKVFQKQESMADSIVSLIMIAVNSLLGWLGDGLSDIYHTQQETYKTFGLYLERADDANEQGALYHNMMEEKITSIGNNNLRNNVKATEWWKAQAGLLEKGFSASQSEQASIENVLLNKIAPTLDTNNQYFLDLQQQGLFSLSRSLGGIVEAVRDTAGSSRVTMGSMSTIIDKLVPVELYTKRELMDNTARAYLSALEQSGMSTADAINLVNDSIEAFYSPYKGLTGGNTLQRIALAQSGGVPSSWEELIGQQIGLAGMFTSGTSNVLTQGAVNSVLGASWLSDWANYQKIDADFKKNLEEELKKDYSPESAYEDLVQAFANDDLFTTAEEMLENIASNSTVANDINGALQLIATDVAFIADLLADVFDKARVLGGDEAYQEEMLNKAMVAETEEEKQKYIDQAVGSYAMGLAKSHEWYEYIPIGGAVSGIVDIAKGDFDSTMVGDLWNLHKYKKSAKEKANANLGGYDVGVGTSGVSDAYLAQHPHYANGGYVKKTELAVVGDNPYGEIISPIPQLSSAVMRGVSLANKNNKPDTTDVEAVIREVGLAIVKAIAENGGSIYIDSSSGLMSGNISTSLKPIMSGKGGH